MMPKTARGGVTVELREVSLHHRGHPEGPGVDALAGISLSITSGELVTVTGPSGSGKSTLLLVIGALAVPTAGRVMIDGQPLDGLGHRRRAALRARTVGFVFQSFNLLGHLSVAQNVALPATLAGRSRRDALGRAQELLDLVGLADKASQRVTALSGGEQQRVAVARALINDPKLILADEPTGNLDSRAGADVVDMLHATHRTGRTVVIVTHDMRLASQAQRIVHLRDGQLTHETRPSSEADEARGVHQLVRTDHT